MAEYIAMKASDRTLQAGTCAALEVAARRGLAALEACIARLTPRQRALVDQSFIDELRAECAKETTT